MTSLALRGTRVLVSGAGVAGPAVAYWLVAHGAEVTVVEAAPALRTSGFNVDFRGPTHLGVLRRMGVLDELRALRTDAGAMSSVDEHGREIFRLPAAFAGGDLEVHRADLSRVLYERTADRVRYLFGERIVALAETADTLRVDLAGGGSRTVDLVVGADGLHSGVRRLAFGPEPRYVRHLGYHIAGWSLPNELAADTVSRQYAVPGRMASVVADTRDTSRATAMLVFASPRLEVDWQDIRRQKQLITDRYAGLGWHLPHLLASLPAAAELYFDAIARVRMPRWHAGRCVLLGDAAWGVTLGGMGVGTGIVGGYVLAGELAAAGGDHRAAFAGYERRMRGYASRWQRGANPGKFLAPATAAGLWLRNTLLSAGPVRRLMIASTRSMATDQALPDYPAAG